MKLTQFLILATCATLVSCSPQRIHESHLAHYWNLDIDDPLRGGQLHLEKSGNFLLLIWSTSNGECVFERSGSWRIVERSLILSGETSELVLKAIGPSTEQRLHVVEPGFFEATGGLPKIEFSAVNPDDLFIVGDIVVFQRDKT